MSDAIISVALLSFRRRSDYIFIRVGWSACSLWGVNPAFGGTTSLLIFCWRIIAFDDDGRTWNIVTHIMLLYHYNLILSSPRYTVVPAYSQVFLENCFSRSQHFSIYDFTLIIDPTVVPALTRDLQVLPTLLVWRAIIFVKLRIDVPIVPADLPHTTSSNAS